MRKIQTEDTLRSINSAEDFPEIDITYSDEDIIFIDSIKEIYDSPPTKIGINSIVLCFSGRVQAEVNGSTMLLKKNQLLLCPPNTTIENVMTSPDYDCKLLCLTNRILQAFLRPYINIWNLAMYINKMKVRELTEEDMSFVLKFYELLKLCINEEGNLEYKKDIIKSLLQAALLGLCSILGRSINKDPYTPPTHSDSTFRKFLDMLNREGSKRHNVNYYADRLCITPKYLSLLCSKNSGKSAKEWIDEYINENVRFYLRSTDKSMKEISDIIGFPNASYFGRYVKEHFGVSPKTYRGGESADE